MLRLRIMIAVILLLLQQTSSAHENMVKTEVFLSPEIVLEPGLVSFKSYYNIDFPRAHIALKGFTAELVDEAGNPVPLHETYLHHWVLERYYYARKVNIDELRPSNYSVVRNSGVCDSGLIYYYGVGGETRRTPTDIPDPYGIHIGDPASMPTGYEEGWMLIVHAIDIRGAEDGMGCSECRCDLYGVKREDGYRGGLGCCVDGKICRLKQGFHGEKKRLYLRYTVKYVDWDASSILPLRIYVLDVTDVWTEADESKGIAAKHHCKVEYDVEACDADGMDKNGCLDSKVVQVSLPNGSGGDVIYGVGHQHAGATALTLYGEGGRTICSSNPIYGEGNEAGNEAGFIVGMSTCYPSPAGAVRISAGETLTLVSNYSSVGGHTGVMALFYLLLADSVPPKPPPSLPLWAHEITRVPNFVWAILVLGAVILVFAWKGKMRKAEGYEAMI